MRFGKYLVIIAALAFFAAVSSAQVCVDCHKKVTPNVVHDWELS
jgi:hypothetical protein